MEEMLKAAANFGFPMVVAFYLLVRIEKKLEILGNAITGLTSAVDRINQAGNNNSNPNTNKIA